MRFFLNHSHTPGVGKMGFRNCLQETSLNRSLTWPPQYVKKRLKTMLTEVKEEGIRERLKMNQ